MNDPRTADPWSLSEPGQRQAASLLVRLWREPQPEGRPPGPLRYFARNLRTGEQRYLVHAEDLALFLSFQVEPEAVAEAPSEGTPADRRTDTDTDASGAPTFRVKVAPFQF